MESQVKQRQNTAIYRTTSYKHEQIVRMAKHIDLSRHGAFSQFVQDAIDEKLAKLERQNKTQRRAS